MVQINIDTKSCVGCGACEADCLARAIRVENGCARIVAGCFMCGHCVAVCPAGAVSMEGDGYDMEDVIPADRERCGIAPDRLLSFIKCRRSIRRFTGEPVEREALEQMIEAGRFSPTGSNAQNVSYIVFRERTEELRKIAMEEFRKLEKDEAAFAEVFPPPMSRSRVDFKDDDFMFKGAAAVLMTISPSAVNAAIAASNMELSASAMGLGAVYIGFFVLLAEKNERIRRFLGLGDGEVVRTCLALGRPAVSYFRSVPRKTPVVKWR